ncbi:GAF domain-containing protein [Advenella incenata]
MNMDRAYNNVDWLSNIDALESAAALGDGLAMLAAVERIALPSLSHTLCTVNRFDEQTMRVVRVYSTNPTIYPVGGSKEKQDTKFAQHVLVERRIFVGEGTAAIRNMFDDHEVITGLGVRSIINVPIVLLERCLGTINFSLPTDQVSLSQVGNARFSAILAATAFNLLGIGLSCQSSAAAIK